MAWDLATAKLYLGANDPDTPEGDLVIQQVLDETLASIQEALGRDLLLDRVVERYTFVDSQTLLMHRFPIKVVHTITMTSNASPWPNNVEVHRRTGWIRSNQFPGQREVVVDYEGGYEKLPVELERAMWSAFLTLHADTNPTTGAPPAGAGTTVVAGSGEVSSVTLADFGTIRYDVGSSVSQAATAAEAAEWGWLSPWYTTFRQYRAGQAGLGLGIA